MCIRDREYSPDKYAYDLSDQEWVSRYTDWGKECCTYDGRIVFLNTSSIDGYGFLYNMDLLEKAGKEIPKTFDELVAPVSYTHLAVLCPYLCGD